MTRKSADYLRKTAELPAVALDKTGKVGKKALRELGHDPSVKRSKKYWRTLGPGLVTGASGQDPSGIATFSQTGAQYGFQYLWMAAWLYPLDANLQSMCARIGLVTKRGLAANIRAHFPRKVLYACALLMFIANAVNIGADLGAMAKAVQLLSPRLSFGWLVGAFAIICLGSQIYVPYVKYAKYLKWLALALLSYVVSAFLAHLDWGLILHHAIVPHLHPSKEAFVIICAVLGTTISPYLFFWQTSQEVEEQQARGKKAWQAPVHRRDMRAMKLDVWSGMFLSEAVMFFIIAACGGLLHANGVTNITSAAQAAQALQPFAGDATYLLFAIGIISAGLLAIPVLAGSSSYIVAESFGWKEGLYRKLGNASAFYGIIMISVLVGLAINFIGIDPIRALIYAAVVNGIVAPVIMTLILLISSNAKVMGKWANGALSSWVGWLTTGAMSVAGVAAIYALIWK